MRQFLSNVCIFYVNVPANEGQLYKQSFVKVFSVLVVLSSMILETVLQKYTLENTASCCNFIFDQINKLFELNSVTPEIILVLHL